MFLMMLMFQLALAFFLNQFGVSIEFNAYFLIIVNILYTSVIYVKKYSDISGYLLFGFFTRILVMLWDIYARHIFIFPNSGGDSRGFYSNAVLLANNLNIQALRETVYGGYYTKLLGSFFHLIGNNIILGQYVNVLLGMTTIIYVYKTLKLLEVRKRYRQSAIFIVTFMPNTLLFSAILLREMVVTFFVTVSVYYFVKWCKEGSTKNQLSSILAILFGSVFHAGVIGVLVGYVIIYTLYDRELKRINVTANSIVFLLIATGIGIIVLNNSDLFLAKITSAEELDLVSVANNRGRGGSQYLSNLQLNTLLQVIFYSPIYMLYFLFSPLPWDWRSGSDVIVFLVDSTVYLSGIWIMIRGSQRLGKNPKNKYVLMGLVLSLLSAIIIFSLGVSNAGTAMRHRHKLFTLLVILAAGILENNYSKKSGPIQLEK